MGSSGADTDLAASSGTCCPADNAEGYASSFPARGIPMRACSTEPPAPTRADTCPHALERRMLEGLQFARGCPGLSMARPGQATSRPLGIRPALVPNWRRTRRRPWHAHIPWSIVPRVPFSARWRAQRQTQDAQRNAERCQACQVGRCSGLRARCGCALTHRRVPRSCALLISLHSSSGFVLKQPNRRV